VIPVVLRFEVRQAPKYFNALPIFFASKFAYKKVQSFWVHKVQSFWAHQPNLIAAAAVVRNYSIRSVLALD
jgi:hypothetical protein